ILGDPCISPTVLSSLNNCSKPALLATEGAYARGLQNAELLATVAAVEASRVARKIEDIGDMTTPLVDASYRHSFSRGTMDRNDTYGARLKATSAVTQTGAFVIGPYRLRTCGPNQRANI